MPNERNVNELTPDELLTVLADARCSFNDASTLDQEEKKTLDDSANLVKHGREQFDRNAHNIPSKPENKARRPLRQPPVEPLSVSLLGWCCLLLMICAMGLLFYALYLDFFPNKTTHTVITVRNIKQETLETSSLASAPLLNDTTSNAYDLLGETVVSEASAVSKSIAVRENVNAPVAEVLPKVISDNAKALKSVVQPEKPVPMAPQIREKRIADIAIGDRTVGANPLGAEPSEADATIFERVKHYGYRLRYQKPNGTYCDIVLLRPADWLYSEDVRIRCESTGQVLDDLDFQLAEFFPISFLDYDDFAIEVFLTLPEMGVMGWSKLVEIDENVQIQPGPGNVVTGTFAHIADSVIDLLIEDRPKPIGCTSNHPFWSVDRHDFVEAGDLQEGERVLLYNGDTKRIVSKLSRPGPQTVYNLEVYSEHVYQVTADGVLVHNSCGSKPKQIHHFATNKHRYYTPRFEKIANKYKLDLDGDWNKMSLPHQGRHVTRYHEFVLTNMEIASKKAGRSKKKFLAYYKQYVIDYVANHPEILYK